MQGIPGGYMKKIMLTVVALGMVGCQPADDQQETGSVETASPSLVSQAQAADIEKSPFETENDKVSYSIGLKYGESMKRDVSEINVDVFVKGFGHGFDGKKPELSEQEVMATLQAFQTRKMQEMQEKQQAAMVENKTKSDTFLNENKQREGVVTLESGLQYEVLASGEGASPKADDTVKVHYHGTLVDGTVFDSSVDRGQPAVFGVNRVIKGWTEALQLMKAGDKWKVVIPSSLAYGERGAGDKIGPNATLVFEVELLAIEEKLAEAAPADAKPTEAKAANAL